MLAPDITPDTATEVKIILMKAVSKKMLDRYGGAKPFGAWARASQDTGIDKHYLSRLSSGQAAYFSIDRLLAIAGQLGMTVKITAE